MRQRRPLRSVVVLALAAATVGLVPGASSASGVDVIGIGSAWDCGDWGMYGRTFSRQFSSDCPTRIAPDTVATLRHAWTFRVPPELGDQATFTASPAIVNGTVYIGGWDGVMYALDLDDGSVKWTFETEPAPGATYGPIVSSAAVAEVGGASWLPGPMVRRLVIFGAGPRLYALSARTGRLVWETYLGSGIEDDPAEIQSSPVVYHDDVYVGFDVHNKPGGEAGGKRGGLIKLDAWTGEVLWKYSPERAAGLPASGCGGVWGSPTINVRRSLVYFGSANCPAVDDDPRLPMEEITALNIWSGRPVWTFRPHQPEGQQSYEDRDEDFGATPNLFRDAGGRMVLGAGNKDGTYYALHPRTGKLLWSTHVSDPAPGVGGFIGSTAVWRGDVFGATAIGSPPSYHSIDGATGDIRWQGLTAPSYGASAVTNGVAFAGALDATLKAFDTETGRVLWASPTLGAISSGPAIVGDMVVVGSGTSTSDACAKDRPGDEACVVAFDALLGQQGGVHAFRLPD